MPLAILTSHPVQYYAPLFREIARHVDVTVFFAHRATPKQQADAGFGVAFDWDIDLLQGYKHIFLNNVAGDPGAHHFGGCDTPSIGEEIAGGRFSALMVTGWHLKCYWQGVFAARGRRVPVIVRGDSQIRTPRAAAKRIAKEVAYPFLLRTFNAALYVGARNRAYYEHYGYPAHRLFHSPHCVDTERFAAGATQAARSALRRRLGIGPQEKAVLFAGKLVAFKRPLDVVDAAAIARSRGLPLHVIIAGSGPLEAEIRARAATFGVPLHLLGFRNQTQMPAAYAAADVLALPSTARETWGLACNEALACGTPIVVSDAVGCAPDLANDGRVGRTFPMGDVATLADAIAAVSHTRPADAIRQICDRHSLTAAAAGLFRAVQYLTVPSARKPDKSAR